MCVCMYVGTYVCMFVCVCIYVCICVYVCMSMYMYVCLYVGMYAITMASKRRKKIQKTNFNEIFKINAHFSCNS